MIRRLTAAAATLAVLWLVSGCAPGREVEPPRAQMITPVIGLSGAAYAREVQNWGDLPGGEGANGQAGDFMLENAFVRFVVGAPGREDAPELAGCVLDAAVQGGPDRLRLLAPAVGVDGLLRPACTGVSIVSAGGTDQAAVVEATAELRGDADLEMVTTYRLEPDTSSLEITTTVNNTGDKPIEGLYMGDIVHHGRTLRYAPDGGLMPVGRRTQSKWLAFFHDRFVWGLLSSPLSRIDAIHTQGAVAARYAVDLVPSGGSRKYRRYLVAEIGGTGRIAQLAGAYTEAQRSFLELAIADEDGKPVKGARALIVPVAGKWPVLLVSDEEGRASLELAGGSYGVTVWAPGRAPWGPADVATAVGGSHRQTVTLSEPARALVKVVGEIGQFAAPASARVAVTRSPREYLPFPPPTPYPIPGFSGAVLSLGEQRVELPLAPGKFGSKAVGQVTALRGPLSDVGTAQAQAAPGDTADAVVTVRRAVDPGGYIAVDCRRHTHASTDSPLTRDEQLLAGACQGLQAVVLAGPRPPPPLPAGPELAECCAVNSVRIVRDGVGAFSAYPVGDRDWDAGRFAQLAAEVPASELLSRLRKCFPDAVIQVDEPLDEAHGYFRAAGFDVVKRTRVPAGLSANFDAIEILTGDDVPRARRLLVNWFRLLNEGRRVFVTGSSALRSFDLGTSGATRTFLRCEPQGGEGQCESINRALRSLRAQPDAFVTNGPFVEMTVAGRPIGSTVAAVDGKTTLSLRISAPGWVDVTRTTVYLNGVVLQELPVPPAQDVVRLEQTIPVSIAADGWLVVVVEGDRPMSLTYATVSGAPTPFAVTNPIWVDADGDGVVGAVKPQGR